MSKPILSIDFDGTLHSYTSGWQGAATINDPPVPGAMRFLYDAAEHFDIAVFSSRSHQEGGVAAMQDWIWLHFDHWAELGSKSPAQARARLRSRLSFPTAKPPAAISLDDRAWQFNGQWPAIRDLLAFKPWNKRDGSSKSIDAAMEKAYTASLPESLIDDISNEEHPVVYKARMFVNGAEVPLKSNKPSNHARLDQVGHFLAEAMQLDPKGDVRTKLIQALDVIWPTGQRPAKPSIDDNTKLIIGLSKRITDAERHNKMLQKRLAKSANVAMIVNDLNWIKARVPHEPQVYQRIEMMLEGLKVHRKQPFIEPEVKTTNLVVAPDQWSGPEGMEAAIQALRASVFEKFPKGGKVRSIEIEIDEGLRHNKGWR